LPTYISPNTVHKLLFGSMYISCTQVVPCLRTCTYYSNFDLFPDQPQTDMVTLTEPPSTNVIGLVVGLPLGALLLAVVFLITAVAVVIVVCVQLSRKKEKISACAVQYEVVGPPQLS